MLQKSKRGLGLIVCDRRWWSVSVLTLDEAVLVTSFLWSVSVLNLDEVELSGPLPRFLPTPTFYSVTVGDTAILECAVVELDDKKVLL